jgi:ABC-type amino acid transport substrate-binding protein
LEVQFYPNLSFDGLYDALLARQVDVVISAVVVDLERSADFAFSTPYFDAGQVFVVSANGADIDEMKDLTGRALAVELGSDGDTIARRWARRLDGTSLLHTDSASATLAAVAGGHAHAALIDRATALVALKEYADVGLYISGAPVTSEQYAAVTLKESSVLLDALDAALAGMHRDGTLLELEKRWLGP